MLIADNVSFREKTIRPGISYSVEKVSKQVRINGEVRVRRHVNIKIWTDRVSLWQKIKNKFKKKKT
jgi:hypothetical protein